LGGSPPGRPQTHLIHVTISSGSAFKLGFFGFLGALAASLLLWAVAALLVVLLAVLLSASIPSLPSFLSSPTPTQCQVTPQGGIRCP
jgi:hypothetical protein